MVFAETITPALTVLGGSLFLLFEDSNIQETAVVHRWRRFSQIKP
jgi:hypothetical protein